MVRFTMWVATATIGRVRLVVLAPYASVAVVLIWLFTLVQMVTQYVALRSNYFGLCTPASARL